MKSVLPAIQRWTDIKPKWMWQFGRMLIYGSADALCPPLSFACSLSHDLSISLLLVAVLAIGVSAFLPTISRVWWIMGGSCDSSVSWEVQYCSKTTISCERSQSLIIDSISCWNGPPPLTSELCWVKWLAKFWSFYHTPEEVELEWQGGEFTEMQLEEIHPSIWF